MKKYNYEKAMRNADKFLSSKWQKQMNDRHFTKGRDQVLWQSFAQQQQEALGLGNYGGGIQTPAAATWLSQSWSNTPAYPAGNGTLPVVGSFVQLNGVVYAIPGTVASTAGTPPPGGVWVVQPPAPGGNAWQVNPVAKSFSQFSTPTSDFPKPPVATDVVDSAWEIPDAQVMSTTASQRYIPAPGVGFLQATITTTASSIQLNINGTFTTVLSTGTGSFWSWIVMDGLSVAYLSGGTTQNTINFYRLRQTIQS